MRRYAAPGPERRRRRASVEAIVTSTRRTYDKPTDDSAVHTKPREAIQKRIRAVTQGPQRDFHLPPRPLTGFIKITRDRKIDPVQINHREGPKARISAPRIEASPGETFSFEALENEFDQKLDIYNRPCMDMLIATETFKERFGKVVVETDDFLTDEREPWEVYSAYIPDEKSPLRSCLNEMHIELRQSQVPESRVIDGRIFFDLSMPTTVESIDLDVSRFMAMTTPDGKVNLPLRKYSGHRQPLKLLPSQQRKLHLERNPADTRREQRDLPLPKDFALVEGIPRKVALPAGTSAVPFQIYAPDDLVASFTYTSLKGPSVLNSYFVDAAVSLGGYKARTGPVPIQVPALGNPDIGYYYEDTDRDFIINNKYFTKDEGFGFSIGYPRRDEDFTVKDKVTAQVVRVATCTEIGLNEEVPMSELKSIEISKKSTNPVLEKYTSNSENPRPRTEWVYSGYADDFNVQGTTPTVSTNGFTCDYFLKVIIDGRTYKGPVIKVDRYTGDKLRRTDIGPNSKKNTFRH